jgi:hypothetical protein
VLRPCGPRLLSARNVALAVYSLVWGAAGASKLLHGTDVTTEFFGAYGLGVTAILIAFRDTTGRTPPKPPETS